MAFTLFSLPTLSSPCGFSTRCTSPSIPFIHRRVFSCASPAVSSSKVKASTLKASRLSFGSFDVIEGKDSYTIYADVPGLTSSDVHVQVIEGSIIKLSGKRKSSVRRTEGTFHRVERLTGAFQRVFELPSDADLSRIVADVTHGVATVTIPKTATHTIDVPVTPATLPSVAARADQAHAPATVEGSTPSHDANQPVSRPDPLVSSLSTSSHVPTPIAVSFSRNAECTQAPLETDGWASDASTPVIVGQDSDEEDVK